MKPLLRIALSLLLAGALGHAFATPPPDGADTPPSWSSLSAAQRDVLAPLQHEWDTLPARKRAHMLHRAEHWATLPPEKRAEIRQRIARWQQMTPEQRRQARANMREFHKLPREQREQLHATFEHFQSLPPPQRERLLREWRALTPRQRLEWREPPHAGQPTTAPVPQQTLPSHPL
jgi:acyl-CoA reductase-like NAD-dependent aldehyde dehydrogenase